MLKALVDGVLSSPQKGIKGSCPFCGDIMISKCGDSDRIHHWAHKSKDCDDWQTGKETEWHLNWKKTVGEEYAEKRINKEEKFHVADVLIKGKEGMKDLIIEFQNSPLSQGEIKKREQFYGEGLIWVINGTELGEKFKIERNYLQKHFYNWHFSPRYEINCDEFFNPNIGEYGAYLIEIPDKTLNLDYVKFITNEGYSKCYIAYLPIDKGYFGSSKETCKYRVYYKSFENDDFEFSVWKQYIEDFDRKIDTEYQKFLSQKNSFSCSYNWKYARKDFNMAERPIFIDLNDDEMFLLEKGQVEEGGKGQLVRKSHFLNRIGKRIELSR